MLHITERGRRACQTRQEQWPSPNASDSPKYWNTKKILNRKRSHIFKQVSKLLPSSWIINSCLIHSLTRAHTLIPIKYFYFVTINVPLSIQIADTCADHKLLTFWISCGTEFSSIVPNYRQHFSMYLSIFTVFFI